MADESRSIARVQFLGQQRVEVGNEVITPEAERLFAMIVRLCVPIGRITARQTMMDILWPGSDEANARHNLRQTVYKARELGLMIESGEDGLRLDPRYWAADWDDPVGDVPGEWLIDYDPVFSSELSSWVTAQRPGIHALVRPRIVRALQAARSAGDLTLADRHAVRLLRIDELNEEATLTRAEFLAMQGSKADALRLLDAYIAEIGRLGAGQDAALPAQLLRRRIAEKLPTISYQQQARHHGPLVGRQRELKRLTAGLFDARAGRGGGVVLHGPDGSGKSRLMHELCTSALLQGMRVVTLPVDTTPDPMPFAALRALVRRLLDVPGALGVSPESLQALRAWLESREFAPDDCPLFEIEDLLAAVSEETPLLIQIEHVERIDAESLGRIDRIYRRGGRRYHMLVLTTSMRETPPGAPVTLQWLERMSLHPMTTVDVRAVVAAWSAVELPRATTDQVACAAVFAEGVPMYGIEMLGLMLDAGSPDVIPWRVQVAVDRALRELSELQWRILVLCQLMGPAARQAILSAALRVEEMELAVALDGLETSGFVQCEEGVLRASPLMADEAGRRVKPAVARMDARFGADPLLAEWSADRRTPALFAALRLLAVARETVRCASTLDTEVGQLLRRETAETITFEFGRLREIAGDTRVIAYIDATVRQIAMGSSVARPSKREAPPTATPATLHLVSATDVESEYVFSTVDSMQSALAVARDPNASIQTRLSEAVAALALASNRMDSASLSIAFQAVRAIRYAPGINLLDLYRADVIYYTSCGEREAAAASAELLSQESRLTNDPSLAARGFRNAAEVFQSIGNHDRSQALLLEARELASSHGYFGCLAKTDIRLAELAILDDDALGARAYLTSAKLQIEKGRITARTVNADLHFFTCWTEIISDDISAASKAAKQTARFIRGEVPDNTRAIALATRLATHQGKEKKDLARDFAILKRLVGRWDYFASEQYVIAALALTSVRFGYTDELAWLSAVTEQNRQERGQRIWPFVSRVLARKPFNR